MKSISSWVNAIYDLVKETNQLEDFKLISLSVIKNLEDSNELETFLGDHFLDFKIRESFIKETFQNEIFANTLCLITKENKAFYLKSILQAVVQKINKELKIQPTLVWTTTNLDESTIDHLKQIVEKKYNQKVEMYNKIDTTLIGGIKMEIGDKVFDYSIKNNLQNLHKKILEGEN